jgi:MFS family permease
LAVTSKTEEFPAAQVNYFDQINLFVAGQQLQQTFGRDTQQLGRLFAAFFWSYAVMQIPTGLLLDRSGVSPIGRIGAIPWSCGTALTTLAGVSDVIGMRPVALTICRPPSSFSFTSLHSICSTEIPMLRYRRFHDGRDRFG